MPRRTDISPILIAGVDQAGSGALSPAARRLARVPALAALFLAGSGAEARIAESRTPLGMFTLVEEVSVLGPDEVPIMHVDQDWTKLHLVFSTADRLTKLEVVDDGGNLEIAIDSAGCLSRSYPFGYGEDPRGRKLHRAMEAAAKALFKICPKLSPTQKSRYLAELRQTRSEFPEALAAMKTRATAIFGGWRRRCTKYSSRLSGDPFSTWRCLRYSAPSN